jgi:hypothetical protein
MVHVSVQVVSSYVTPWLSNTCLISVISFVIILYVKTGGTSARVLKPHPPDFHMCPTYIPFLTSPCSAKLQTLLSVRLLLSVRCGFLGSHLTVFCLVFLEMRAVHSSPLQSSPVQSKSPFGFHYFCQHFFLCRV